MMPGVEIMRIGGYLKKSAMKKNKRRKELGFTDPLRLCEKFPGSGRLDSNQRPLRPERNALPGCATARKKSRVDWIRTSDLLHPMQMRYRAAPPPEQLVDCKCSDNSKSLKPKSKVIRLYPAFSLCDLTIALLIPNEYSYCFLKSYLYV
jgi:hypothetical protein